MQRLAAFKHQVVMPDLKSLVYASKVSPGYQDSVEIDKILTTARANNRARGITGVLLCNLHYFLQVLEGPEKTVSRLYQTIADDQRHQDIIRLSESRIDARKFAGWQMGFYLVQEADANTIPRVWTELTAPQANHIFDTVIASSQGKGNTAFYPL